MSKRLTKVLLVIVTVLSMLFSQVAFVQGAGGSEAAKTDAEYLKSVIDMIKEKHKGEVTDNQLVEGALKGMFNTMDPYTTYLTQEEANAFLDSANGDYEGVGLMIEKEDSFIKVLKVLPLSPAEKAGIIMGDKIVTVDGKSMVGVSMEKAAVMLQGPAGTKVSIGIIREGKNEVMSVEVERGAIKVNPVTYEIRGDIGYIKVDAFSGNVEEGIAKVLEEMDKNNIKKIVLDLRDNPGGDVEQAVALAEKFVPKGLITRLEYKSDLMDDEEYYSELEEKKYQLAVLVNGNSASAAEIVIGAIQDTEAGTVIGTKTFGKAKVQSVIPLLTPEAYQKYQKKFGGKVVDAYDLFIKYDVEPKDEEILGWYKMTTATYTTPKGRMIDGVGITPDIIVEDTPKVKDIDITSIQKLTMTWKPELNSEGADVYNAEKILRILGYDVDTPDLKLDEKTCEAISKFRTDNGLYPGGTLDFATQKALNSKLEEKILELDKQYLKAVEVLSK